MVPTMGENHIYTMSEKIFEEIMHAIVDFSELRAEAQGTPEREKALDKLGETSIRLREAIYQCNWNLVQWARAGTAQAVKDAELDNLRSAAESNRAAAAFFKSMAESKP